MDNTNDAALGLMIGVLASSTLWLCYKAVSLWSDNIDLQIRLEHARQQAATAATYR